MSRTWPRRAFCIIPTYYLLPLIVRILLRVLYVYICSACARIAIMHCSPNETIFRSNVMCVGKYDRRYGPVRLMFLYCTSVPSLHPTVINNWNSAAVVVSRIWKTYPKPCGLHKDAAQFWNTIWFLLLFFFQNLNKAVQYLQIQYITVIYLYSTYTD